MRAGARDIRFREALALAEALGFRLGHSPAEALREVERAKGLWLEAAKAEGRPIPKPRYRPQVGSTA